MRFPAIIFLAAFLIFGQIEEIQDTAEILPEISLENTKKKVTNHRYIVVSAIMMMLFVGLAMGTVSSINPD